jgi:hypothetical protein
MLPFKFTWKSIAGVLAALAGAISSVTNAGLPHSVDAVLVGAGLAVVGLERVADAIDFGNTPKVTVPVVSVPPAPVQTTQTVTVPPGHTVQVVPVVSPGA